MYTSIYVIIFYSIPKPFYNSYTLLILARGEVLSSAGRPLGYSDTRNNDLRCQEEEEKENGTEHTDLVLPLLHSAGVYRVLTGVTYEILRGWG